MSRTTHLRAAAVIMTAVATAALISGPGSSGSPAAAAPGPVAKPTVVAKQTVLAKANLPGRRDLEFHEAGDWKIIRTSATLGLGPVTDCFSYRNLETLGASAQYRRDYRLGADNTQRAVAVAMEFRTAKTTRAGYASLKRWIRECPAALHRLGYEQASVGPWAAVSAGNRAAYTVVDHSILNSPAADEQAFEEFGLTRTGRRLAVVIMKTTGQDYNWSAAPSEELATYPMIRSLPKVARRLGRDLTAARHLTDAQLIKVGRVPAYGDQKISIARPGAGRRQDSITVCTRSVGVRELHAAQVRSRSFMIDEHRPSIFIMALQYGDAEAASSAARTFRERIEVCGKQLREEGYWVGSSDLGWVKAPTTRGSGRFTELVYKRPGHAGDEAGYFESIGLTRVGDRLMITVTVVYGQDYNVSLDPQGDPETGLPPHPQFALIKAAASRLAA